MKKSQKWPDCATRVEVHSFEITNHFVVFDHNCKLTAHTGLSHQSRVTVASSSLRSLPVLPPAGAPSESRLHGATCSNRRCAPLPSNGSTSCDEPANLSRATCHTSFLRFLPSHHLARQRRAVGALDTGRLGHRRLAGRCKLAGMGSRRQPSAIPFHRPHLLQRQNWIVDGWCRCHEERQHARLRQGPAFPRRRRRR